MLEDAESAATGVVCRRCEKRPLRFTLDGQPMCLYCALRYPPMLRRSLLTAMVVGSILTAINQGDLLLHGDLTSTLVWKIPLTYTVPFCVATWGGLVNSRVRH